MYNLEQRQFVKWLYGKCQPNAHAIQVMLALADFLDADFKEMFKTASVLVLRWWLQFRRSIGSASRKKLKLLMYRHVYPA